MAGKLIIEILILWIIYAGYMAVLVHKRGPLGGIFFYPKVMQERVIEMGLMTRQELRSRRSFAYILLLALIIFVPGIMILRICLICIIPKILKQTRRSLPSSIFMAADGCTEMQIFPKDISAFWLHADMP